MGPVRFAEKTNRNTVSVDLLGEKILFRLKKQAKKYGLQDKRTGPLYLKASAGLKINNIYMQADKD